MFIYENRGYRHGLQVKHLLGCTPSIEPFINPCPYPCRLAKSILFLEIRSSLNKTVNLFPLRTLEELLVEMQPFSPELKTWCLNHADFLQALKLVHPDRFVTLFVVFTSTSPNFPDDEVIGLYTYDYKIKDQKFKQDFIVNKDRENKEFILYTRNPNGGSSKYIKDINEFYSLYGKGGYYKDTYHVGFENLPDQIKPQAARAIQIANNLRVTGIKNPSQSEIDETYKKLKELQSKY